MNIQKIEKKLARIIQKKGGKKEADYFLRLNTGFFEFDSKLALGYNIYI